MLVVRWLLLWDVAHKSSTKVSVVPAARHVAAPYPVHCKFSVIGGGNTGASIVLEGPKVNQPAEVVLEELFPPETLGISLKSSSGTTRGVLVELLPTRRSLDLSLSRCIVERVNGNDGIRYIPWSLTPLSRPARASSKSNQIAEQDLSKQRAYPVFLEEKNTLNLVAINSGSNTGTLGIELVNFDVSNSQSDRTSQTIISQRSENIGSTGKSYVDLHIDSGVCLEYPLASNGGAKDANNCDRGAVGLFEATNSDDIAIYSVLRDRQTNNLVSISAL